MRASGILMHISSLPEKNGIGTFGRQAYRFVDFLEKSGQKYWQILPMGPTGYGNSPYQSCSAFAGNPFFIDLDFLRKDGLLRKEEYAGSWGDNAEKVDYDILTERRLRVLYKAYERFVPGGAYEAFCRRNREWLDDYALYMAIRNALGVPWMEWPEALRQRKRRALAQASREYEEEIGFQKFLQYKFYEQWGYLKRYANRKGVYIIGDMPIYAAADSADTWSNPSQFQLKSDGYPQAVSGCPPDDYAKTGQLWGNPVYRWDRMKKDGYKWWLDRIGAALKQVDMIRLDHFRGLESYYSISAEDKTAEHGHWVKGPGMSLFYAIRDRFGKVPFIAEDLGMLTPEVHELRHKAGFPGMSVLQFAFSLKEESTYLPHNCKNDTVIYTGTHDNNTTLGWFDSLTLKEQMFVMAYTGVRQRSKISWGLIRSAWASPADLAIAQMQEVLNLPAWARMNTPGTVGGNWEWRMKPDEPLDEIAYRLNHLTSLYFRKKHR